MKLITFKDGPNEKIGVIKENKVFEIGTVTKCKTMLELISKYDEDLKEKIEDYCSEKNNGIEADTIRLEAPIPCPKHDIICLGQNYLEHAVESAKFKGIPFKKPQYPVYFSKRVVRAIPHEEYINGHLDMTNELDYETELAVIIGKECKEVERDKAYEYVFGYTIVNDVTARDLQNAHKQFYFGKSLDDFTAMGPCIVTADEIYFPPSLCVKTRVNEEIRQNGSTNQFIFDIPYIISELSKGITLEAGDIIITGTPSGVGMGFDPPRFLKKGDVIESEIEKIGILRNEIK